MPSQVDLFVSFAETLTNLLHTSAIPPRPLLMVACSGGVDSMTLLHLTHRYCERTGASCLACYVNHGLRETAKRDERLIRLTARQLGIPVAIRPLADDSGVLPSGKGQESELRTLRYQVLLREAKQSGASALLVGHHADDQVETVLWRIVRGTSLTGVGGIRSVRWKDGIPILRPLLHYSKQELETYAAERQIQYEVDETNLSLDYTRNALRHMVVPQLKTMNMNLTQSVSKFCEIIQAEDSLLERQAQEVADASIETQSEGSTIQISKLHRFPLPLQRRAIKILLYCLASADWTYQNVDDILQLTLAQSPSASIHLPHGLVAQRIYDVVRIGPNHQLADDDDDRSQSPVDRSFTWILKDQGNQVFTSGEGFLWQFSCRKWFQSHAVNRPNQWSAVFSPVDALVLSTANDGDRIHPLGMAGHKKLQDVFVDAKVPKRLRKTWPVLWAGGEIVWVPGLVRAQHHLLSSVHETGWVVTCKPPPIDFHA